MSANHANYWQQQFEAQKTLALTVSEELASANGKAQEALQQLDDDFGAQLSAVRLERDQWRARARESEDLLAERLALAMRTPPRQTAGALAVSGAVESKSSDDGSVSEVDHASNDLKEHADTGGEDDGWERQAESAASTAHDESLNALVLAQASEIASLRRKLAASEIRARRDLDAAGASSHGFETQAARAEAELSAAERKAVQLQEDHAAQEASARRLHEEADSARAAAMSATASLRAANAEVVRMGSRLDGAEGRLASESLRLRSALADAEVQIQRHKATISALQQSVDDSRSHARDLELKHRGLQAELATTRSRSAATEADRAAADSRARQMEAQLASESRRAAAAEREVRTVTHELESDARTLRARIAEMAATHKQTVKSLSDRAAASEASRAAEAATVISLRQSFAEATRATRQRFGFQLLAAVAKAARKRAVSKRFLVLARARDQALAAASARARAREEVGKLLARKIGERDSWWRATAQALLKTAQKRARRAAAQAAEAASSGGKAIQKERIMAALATALRKAADSPSAQQAASSSSSFSKVSSAAASAHGQVVRAVRGIRFDLDAMLLAPQHRVITPDNTLASTPRDRRLASATGSGNRQQRPASAPSSREPPELASSPPAKPWHELDGPAAESGDTRNPVPVRFVTVRGLSSAQSVTRKPRTDSGSDSSRRELAAASDLGSPPALRSGATNEHHGSSTSPNAFVIPGIVSPMGSRGSEAGALDESIKSDLQSPARLRGLPSGAASSPAPRRGSASDIALVSPAPTILGDSNWLLLPTSPATSLRGSTPTTEVIARQLSEAVRAARERERAAVQAVTELRVSEATSAEAAAARHRQEQAVEKAVSRAQRELLRAVGEAEAAAISTAREAGRLQAQSEFDAEMRSTTSRFDAKLRDAVNTAVQDTQEAMRAHYEGMLASERGYYEAAQAELTAALYQQEQQHQQLTEQAQALRARVEEANVAHTAATAAERKQCDADMRAVASRVASVSSDHRFELERLREEHVEAVKALDRQHQKQLADAVAEAEAKLQRHITALVAAAASDAGRHRTDRKRAVDSAVTATRTQEASEWQERVEALQAQLADVLAAKLRSGELAQAPIQAPPLADSGHATGDAPAEEASKQADASGGVVWSGAVRSVGVDTSDLAVSPAQPAESLQPALLEPAPAAREPDATQESAALLSKMRAEVIAQFSAKLQSAAESKREALTKLADEAKLHTEMAVVEERKRAATDKELAVRRVFKRAEALMKGIEVKLKAAIEARSRAEKLSDTLSIKQEAAEMEAVKLRLKAQMFHRVSMILRLRLAVVATKFTAMHCTRISQTKRVLGRRIVLLEQRYERDVVQCKARGDVALKRAIIIEQALLQASSVLGLQNESKAFPGAAQAAISGAEASPATAALAMLDGAGTGSAALQAQDKLKATRESIIAIKVRLLEVREELHKLRQRRNEIIGGARLLDVEINLMGKQIAHSNGRSDETGASRLQRLHKNLEASAASAQRVRDEIVPLEKQHDALKDERRALKARAKAIEARVLERVVKQHMQARRVLHGAGLGPQDLLPARMGRYPEPEPLHLELLLPRHVLDVDGFAFDLGRRDYLRARAIGRATAAMQARKTGGRGRGDKQVSASELNDDDSDDEDAGCPALRVLPGALHGETAQRTLVLTDKFIKERLRSQLYDSAVGDGYTVAAAAGSVDTH
jgi:hypothetical protein